MKKIFTSALAFGLFFSVFATTTSATTLIKEGEETEVYLGTFVEYTDKDGNIITEPYSKELIQTIELQATEDEMSAQCIACVGDFTYTTYDIYDQGITKSWSYLSNPYFIISIAKGATYKKSTTYSTTITASYSGDLPSKSGVNSKFGITASGTKSFTREVTLTGPSGNYNSRDFYYQKGRHTHKIRTNKKLRKKNGTVIKTTTHTGYVGVPAVRHYSKDTNF